MAKKKAEEEQCGNWMDTYGDMVTLLMTFFIMLFSMSSVNEEKFAILVKAFTSKDPDTINLILNQVGSEEGMDYPENRTDIPPQGNDPADATLEELQNMVPQDFDDLYDYLQSYVEKAELSESVEVSEVGEGCVFIRFKDNIFFKPNSASLQISAEPLLQFLGGCLKGVEEQIMTVNINGHTADPKGYNQDISDWKLSGERASNVATYFELQSKFDSKKLLPIGYGKNHPIADNDTEEGIQLNRRVAMVILGNDTELTDKEILDSILMGTFDPTQYPESGSAEDILVPSVLDGSVDLSQPEEPGTEDTQTSSAAPETSEPAQSSQPPQASSGSTGFTAQPPASGQASLPPSPSSAQTQPSNSSAESPPVPEGAQVVSPYGG